MGAAAESRAGFVGEAECECAAPWQPARSWGPVKRVTGTARPALLSQAAGLCQWRQSNHTVVTFPMATRCCADGARYCSRDGPECL